MTHYANAAVYRKKPDELYIIIQALDTSSPSEDFDKFAKFFAKDCTVYLKSMNLNHVPGISRIEAAEDMKEVLGKVHIQSREVLNFGLSCDGHTVFCETKQSIGVLGDTIDPFFETEIITFDDSGLITKFKNYSCWSPIVDVMQRKTGMGPYAEGERREEFDKYVKSVAMGKIQKLKSRLEAGKVDATCCT